MLLLLVVLFLLRTLSSCYVLSHGSYITPYYILLDITAYFFNESQAEMIAWLLFFFSLSSVLDTVESVSCAHSFANDDSALNYVTQSALTTHDIAYMGKVKIKNQKIYYCH